MDYELTLSKEQYAIAKQNGISRKLAYNRYYMGWSAEDAITKPKQNRGILKKLQKEAANNGIELTIGAVIGRRTKGWTNEQVVTVPKGGHKRVDDDYYYYINRAASNGIKRNTYAGRRRRGWTKERAATEAVQSAFNWRERA